MDAVTYLFGSDVAEKSRSRWHRSSIMKGCRIKGSAAREPRAYMFNHKIQTRHVMSSHISTMSQVLGAIRFPCYLEKNYKHRDAKEESHGILRAKCLGLGTLQSGKRRLPKSKVFVVTFVCKGTSLCLPNPSVSKFWIWHSIFFKERRSLYCTCGRVRLTYWRRWASLCAT